MRPSQLSPLTPTPSAHRARLYRTTKEPRLRTRAQLVCRAAAQRRKVPQIAAIVRAREAPVWRWLKRYRAEGLHGVRDAPRPGRPSEITAL